MCSATGILPGQPGSLSYFPHDPRRHFLHLLDVSVAGLFLLAEKDPISEGLQINGTRRPAYSGADFAIHAWFLHDMCVLWTFWRPLVCKGQMDNGQAWQIVTCVTSCSLTHGAWQQPACCPPTPEGQFRKPDNNFSGPEWQLLF